MIRIRVRVKVKLSDKGGKTVTACHRDSTESALTESAELRLH